MTDDQNEATEEQWGLTEHPHSGVQSIYFNGFDLGASLSDMSMTLMLDGIPLAKVNMSFTTAKTLCTALGEAVKRFEKVTNHEVMTMGDVHRGYESRDSKK